MEAELSLSRAAVDALADDIAETAAHIDAATHRLLVLIRDFDRAGGWHVQGALSCAHWLSWRIGLGLGPAREKVRVAHRLAELPLIDEALRRGELSFSKVRAMTRVASPANEAALLDQARQTTAAQLERICRFHRQARSLAGEDPRLVEDERRWVATRATEDGMVSIRRRWIAGRWGGGAGRERAGRIRAQGRGPSPGGDRRPRRGRDPRRADRGWRWTLGGDLTAAALRRRRGAARRGCGRSDSRRRAQVAGRPRRAAAGAPRA